MATWSNSGFFGRIKRAGRWLAGVATRKRIAVLLVVLVIGMLVYWWAEILCWAATPVTDGTESYGEVLRNLALLAAATIGLPLAIWRSWVADKHAHAAQRQASTAELSLLHDRYQRNAAMLGSKTLATRIAGVYALERLAEHADKFHLQIDKFHLQIDKFHLQIMDLLCAFIRNPPKKFLRDKSADSGSGKYRHCSPDVEAAAKAIGKQYDNHGGMDLSGAYLVLAGLPYANLSGANLHNAKLIGAVLDDANLSDTLLPYANLSDARLSGANLTSAYLRHADLSRAELSGADLSRANLSGANLSGAGGITQSMLDEAVAKEGKEPKLDNAVCAKTDEPLVWRGKTPPN